MREIDRIEQPSTMPETIWERFSVSSLFMTPLYLSLSKESSSKAFG